MLPHSIHIFDYMEANIVDEAKFAIQEVRLTPLQPWLALYANILAYPGISSHLANDQADSHLVSVFSR